MNWAISITARVVQERRTSWPWSPWPAGWPWPTWLRWALSWWVSAAVDWATVPCAWCDIFGLLGSVLRPASAAAPTLPFAAIARARTMAGFGPCISRYRLEPQQQPRSVRRRSRRARGPKVRPARFSLRPAVGCSGHGACTRGGRRSAHPRPGPDRHDHVVDGVGRGGGSVQLHQQALVRGLHDDVAMVAGQGCEP